MYTIELDAIDKILNLGGFINLVINDVIKKNKLDDSRKALFTKIVYGVVENKLYLDYQLSFYLKNDKIAKDVKNILRMGIYMIHFLNIPNYHVIDALVEQTKEKYSNYTKMVNAILRNLTRNELKEIPTTDYQMYLSIKYSYPLSLVKFIKRQYPENIEEILKPSENIYNTYRINYIKTDKESLLKKLKCDYELKDDAIITKTNLSGKDYFKKSEIVYQDYASQKVAIVMDPEKNTNILDMCSAPGSKSFHIASLLNNECNITSCDIYEHKTKLIIDEAKRQGITCIKTITCDSATYNFDQEYDYVLLDAPCSGLGVMKHKCDLKYRFTLKDKDDIIVLQKSLLGKACKVVKQGGILVYSTCTINKEENEEMIKYFLKKHKDFEILEELNFLPTDIHDGFYICKMIKK
ncbi:MAG: 16S rRNA (cytosine(967)-C(5))-methyltransferase RsmB [Bacilli bacterium]|nr:16S rRNA (cytosine(967)-C(5))-methyltransferase RsmB [Bacilli bacterium]